MAALTADVLKVLEPMVEKVRAERDIFVTVFISFEGVSINIYPYEGESEE